MHELQERQCPSLITASCEKPKKVNTSMTWTVFMRHIKVNKQGRSRARLS